MQIARTVPLSPDALIHRQTCFDGRSLIVEALLRIRFEIRDVTI